MPRFQKSIGANKIIADTILVDTAHIKLLSITSVEGIPSADFPNEISILIGDSVTGSSLIPVDSKGNVLIGAGSGALITDGDFNIAIGNATLENVTTTGSNLAIGVSALKAATGSNNVALGHASLTNLTTGVGNVAVGVASALVLTEGDNNVCIGRQSVVSPLLDNQIALGYQATCDTANQCIIGSPSLNSIANEGDNLCDLGENARQFKDVYLGGDVYVDTVKVLGSQATAIADATDAASVITQLNDLLAKLRIHGIIAT